MHIPAMDDTIIAVSTGWTFSPVGILRLSGPGAYELLREITPAFQPSHQSCSGWIYTGVAIAEDISFPAAIYWFTAPNSYTGQNIIEIHLTGSLPGLRTLSANLISKGARRAMPGEFTARAYLNGKLAAAQADDVLALINTQDGDAARRIARGSSNTESRCIEQITDGISNLLARVEASIDFAEEDVTFLNPRELLDSISNLSERLDDLNKRRRDRDDAVLPHVALAGAPNAGKSTLFNAMLGHERAIVSPILGTTRDVLAVELDIEGTHLVLQDCAGFGAVSDELEAAAHLASEQAAGQADLVLWIHDISTPWTTEETSACNIIPQERRMLVLSKTDTVNNESQYETSLSFDETFFVSAHTGIGLDLMRKALHGRLETVIAIDRVLMRQETMPAIKVLHKLAGMLKPDMEDLEIPEVVAFELRQAYETMNRINKMPLSEEVLENIFSRFCVGK